MVKMVCKQCEKEFLADSYYVKMGRGKYCSPACAGKAKRIGFTLTCKQCGKEYFTPPSRAKNGSKYCSPTCFGKSRRNKVSAICLGCGKAYLARADKFSKHCSSACRIRGADVRFWSHVEKTDTCWNWIAGLTSTGYGSFDKTVKYGRKAHRYSYFLHYGEIPKKLGVLHRCVGNRRCVNPAHLYLGTDKDNHQDAKQQNRIPKGEQVYGSKLTEKDVIEIRRLSNTVSQNQIAALFKVSRSNIGNIINRRLWAHVV